MRTPASSACGPVAVNGDSLRHWYVAVERADLFDFVLVFVVLLGVALIGLAHALRKRRVVETCFAHVASLELDRGQ